MSWDASWWLKVKRAEQHMVNIKRAAKRYAALHPYEFTRVRQPDSKRQVAYRCRITAQPDPKIALQLGDFIHNLRSALDHAYYACIPPKERSNATSFPMTSISFLAKDAHGNFVSKDADARDAYERSLRGLDPKARTIVEAAQAYHLGDQAYRWILGIITRLDNADKHRQLTLVGAGVKYLVAETTIRDQVGALIHNSFRHGDFAKDDTVVGWQLPAFWLPPEYPAPSEVQMEYAGAAEIHIKVTRVGVNQTLADFPLELTITECLREVRRILRLLEPFAIH